MSNSLTEAHRLWREGKELLAIEYYDIALNEARKHKNIEDQIEIMNEYGGALRVVGHYHEADELLFEALDLIENLIGKQTLAYASTLINIGNNKRMMGKLVDAEVSFLEAKQIMESIKSFNYEYSSLCNNLALLYQSQEKNSLALNLLDSAIQYLKSDEKYKLPLAITYNNLASLYLHQNNLQNAKKYILLAEEIYISILDKNHPLIATLFCNKAQLFFKLKQLPLSLYTYLEASKIFEVNFGTRSLDYRENRSNIEFVTKTIENQVQLINPTQFSMGMQQSQKFILEELLPYILKEMPILLQNACIALVGPGSECLGYDDEISTDHDFLAKACIFVEAQKLLDEKESIRQLQKQFKDQVQILATSQFYKHYTNNENGPESVEDYLQLEDHFLATACNGHVFLDYDSEFVKIRLRLLSHYPKDIWLKRMAYTCNMIAQSGQYNYPRCLKRQDYTGAALALSQFIEQYSQAIHLINKKYQPFYKWISRSLFECDILGDETIGNFKELLESQSMDFKKKVDRINQMCFQLVIYFNENDLSESKIDFLTYQATELMKKIKDKKLRESNPWKRDDVGEE